MRKLLDIFLWALCTMIMAGLIANASPGSHVKAKDEPTPMVTLAPEPTDTPEPTESPEPGRRSRRARGTRDRPTRRAGAPTPPPARS